MNTKPDLMRGHLDALLLSILKAGPAHGYAIIAALSERSRGLFELPEGTVYPALHRLEDADLIASAWETVDGRRRRLYRLTAKGRSALVAETASWREFRKGVDLILGSA